MVINKVAGGEVSDYSLTICPGRNDHSGLRVNGKGDKTGWPLRQAPWLHWLEQRPAVAASIVFESAWPAECGQYG
jgi:hypothetical protein